MSQTVSPQSRTVRDAQANEKRQSELTTEELLSLLGDSYTREVLEVIAERPLPGREIVDRTGFSKATVYRRLDTLQDAGLIESETVFDPDGHHRERFDLTFGGATCRFGPEGLETTIHPADDE